MNRILLIYLRVMVDRPQPQITFKKLSQVLSTILDSLKEELLGGSCDREAHNILGELIELASLFCQNAGIQEMNKQLLPLLHQQNNITNYILSETTTELSSHHPPLSILFSHTRETSLFEDFLCGLVDVEFEYITRKNLSFESSYANKLLSRLSQFTQEHQQPQSYIFEIRLRQILKRKSSPTLLASFVSCLNQEQSTKDLKFVLAQLLGFKEDFVQVVDEFAKTFKRKRYSWLFVEASAIVFGILSDQTDVVRFLFRVVSVLQHHVQQSFQIEQKAWLLLLESIAASIFKTGNSEMNESYREEYRQSMMKLWFLVALSNLTNQEWIQPVLIDLATLTPIITYDSDFQLQIRSAAKNQELDQFAESVFETLQNQVLNSRGVRLDNIVRKSIKVDRSQSKNQLDQKISDLSASDKEEENIEVGTELSLPERVYLAWFALISRLKIQQQRKESKVGASFIEQTLNVYGTESNFNIIQGEKNQSITSTQLQKINSPFGKQVDFLTKALVTVHLDIGTKTEWPQDFCHILRQYCSDSWSTRYIAKYLSSFYLMRQPSVPTEVLNTYCKLLNILQLQISQVYNSLSQPSILENQIITLPEDVSLLKNIFLDLSNLLTQQYIAQSVLGNRAQIDYQIQQISSENSTSSMNSGNLGQRTLQSLAFIDINLERLNTADLTQKFKFANRAFVNEIQSIHSRIKQNYSSNAMFNLITQQKQINLTMTQPFEKIENSNLLIQNQEINSMLKVQAVPNSQKFQNLIIQVAEIVQLLEFYDEIQIRLNQGVKRADLTDEVQTQFKIIGDNITNFKEENESFLFKANYYLTNPSICRQQAHQKLTYLVQEISNKATTSVQVISLVQILASQPVCLFNYLLYLNHQNRNLVPFVIESLNLRISKESQRPPKEWQKVVGRLSNKVQKSIRQQFIHSTSISPNDKPILISEQFKSTNILHIDIVSNLKNMGYNIESLLQESYLYSKDLYIKLKFVKLVLETGGSVEVVQKLARLILGKQFKSKCIEEVNMWVQLLVDIRYLIKKEEVVLHFLLSHFKWQIISWNFQFQITSQVSDFSAPMLSSSEAKKFVKRWPKLALQIAEKKINTKFVESYSAALTEYVHQNPLECLRKSATLEIYLQSKLRKVWLANIWRTDNVIQLVRSLSLKSKSDLLTCQLAIKALDTASPKKVIYFLPQLFQSVRIDNKINNIIGDFLIRKSQQSISVAHNVLWFCKVESVLPDERETHARKVPLPLSKENINQLTGDLYKIIGNKLGQEERRFFETETNFFEKITSISGLLQPAQSKDQKRAIIKEKLIEYSQEIPECVYLPTNQNCRVVGIVTTSGMPMQSAARVPILVSFEVEEYPGPDKDQLMVHESLIASVVKQGNENLQSQKVQNSLQKFQNAWVPTISEEDLDDDDSFDQAAHEFSTHEGHGNPVSGLNQLSANTTIQQLTRQLIPKRTMFSNGFQQAINQVKIDGQKLEEKAKIENEEDQRQFIKLIKQQTFKTQPETRSSSRLSTVVSQVINLNQKPNFKELLHTQLGQTTPHKLSKQRSVKPRYNSEVDRPDTLATGHQVQHLGHIKVISCIFKVNDDLRQDILALQFIKHFQRIFKQNDLDLFVAPYRCISNRTGTEKLLGGIIEVVPNSHSRDQLGKAFEINLHEYFLKKYGTESTPEFKTARYNFIRSLAAYAVVSFILQIKDRHNGNILIDESGHLIHIDFGFIFDWSPGKDMKFESAAFKLTQEFIDILGGSSSAPAFRLFENMVIQGYLAVREHSDDFLGLTELMFYSGFPCFKPFSLQNLETRFRKDLSQAEAARWMRDLVQDAANKWTTRVYDFVQYKQNKIVF